MSWMGAAGSFESRAKKEYGASARVAQLIEAEQQHDALRQPLQKFASKAQSLFASLDRKGSCAAGGRAAGADAEKAWVVGIDTEAAEAAAEVAAEAAAALAASSANNTVAANTLANSLQSCMGEEDGEPDVRPPLHTAVLDDNAYDRKMGLCSPTGGACSPTGGVAKGGRKRLGWSPAEVQLIEDDADEEAVIVDVEGTCLAAAAIRSLAAASTSAQSPVAPSASDRPRGDKTLPMPPKGILKTPSAGTAASQPLAKPAALLPAGSARAEEPRVPARGGRGADGGRNGGGGGGKPCFEFAQTGNCRRGAACRFAHALPECMLNPGKYTRYDISWDEEEERGANRAAAMATLALLHEKGMSEEEVQQDQEASLKAAAEREERQRLKRDKLKAEREREGDEGDQNMVSAGGGGECGKGGGKQKKKAKTSKAGPLLSFADDNDE
jgi:hypothetical protein